MSKSKLTSFPMLLAYGSIAAIAALTPLAPLAPLAIGVLALSRSAFGAALQVSSAQNATLANSPPEYQQEADDELIEDNDPDSSFISRGLLTNAPTASPTQVTNCNPSGAGSLLTAFNNAKSSGGALTVTFNASAAGCHIEPSNNINSVTSIIKVDVAGVGSAGITIGGIFVIYFTGSNSVGLNITSSSGPGSITFSDNNFFLYQNGVGAFNFIVGPNVTSTFTNYASINNIAGSSVNVNVKSKGTMVLTDQSIINNGVGVTNVNVDADGSLMMSKGSYFLHRSTGIGVANIQGLLSMGTGSNTAYNTAFYNMKVVVGSTGTLASNPGNSAFMSSSLILSNATHQVIIGPDDYVVQLSACGTANSNATLGGTLNIISYQSMDSLLGRNFTVMTTQGINKCNSQLDAGNNIFKIYYALQFNGSAVNLPYDIYYTQSNVTIYFSTFAPTAEPSLAPSPIPSQRPTIYPTTLPTLQTKEPSTEPSIAPSEPPSKAPSPAPSEPPSKAPSPEPSKTPSGEPSKSPSSAPSEPPSKAPSTQPSKTPSGEPSTPPSHKPSPEPSGEPSGAPSYSPTSKPLVQKPVCEILPVANADCKITAYNISHYTMDQAEPSVTVYGSATKKCMIYTNCSLSSPLAYSNQGLNRTKIESISTPQDAFYHEATKFSNCTEVQIPNTKCSRPTKVYNNTLVAGSPNSSQLVIKGEGMITCPVTIMKCSSATKVFNCTFSPQSSLIGNNATRSLLGFEENSDGGLGAASIMDHEPQTDLLGVMEI